MKQQTISREIYSSGLGLHSGQDVKITLKPAPVNSGIRFQRVDLASAPVVSAEWENVSSTVLATTLGHGENRISTVEHLLATLVSMEIDNLLVEVNGPELPVFDGSASRWIELLKAAGLNRQAAPRKIFKLNRPFQFSHKDKTIEARPSCFFSVEAHIDFEGAIGRHCLYYLGSEKSFTTEISRSRTFCALKDVESMQSQGLALGGSLDNAVVVGDDGIINPDGLRYNDEFVRHKILDFIGDMFLMGGPILGQFIIHKPGHEFNHLFVNELMTQPGLVETVTANNTRKVTGQQETRPLMQQLSLPSGNLIKFATSCQLPGDRCQ